MYDKYTPVRDFFLSSLFITISYFWQSAEYLKWLFTPAGVCGTIFI